MQIRKSLHIIRDFNRNEHQVLIGINAVGGQFFKVTFKLGFGEPVTCGSDDSDGEKNKHKGPHRKIFVGWRKYLKVRVVRHW